MSPTKAQSASSQIHLSPNHVGLLRDVKVTSQSLEACNLFLQRNHEEYHIFFRDVNAHNHIAHSLLSVLALGGSPTQLERAFNDGEPTQRAIPDIDSILSGHFDNDDIFYRHLGEGSQYHTYLAFFQRKIDELGWQRVVQRYCFTHDKLAEAMFSRLYEGAYHPIIHLGLGIEFEQPSIVAEALAQAASHLYGELDVLFMYCQEAAGEAGSGPRRSIMDLADEISENDEIRQAPKFEDRYDRLKNGIIGKAGREFAKIAGQYRVTAEDLDQSTAEMISVCALMAGAAQKPNNKHKVDFFFMHAVTSSIFFSVFINQDWINVADRIRLVESKVRLDLAFYAFNACPKLDATYIHQYKDGFSDGMGWSEIYDFCNQEHDDGHVAKFVRALRNGEKVVKRYETGKERTLFPVQSDMWIKIARLALGTTKGCPQDIKWLFGAGFEQAWKRPDLQ